MLIDTLFSTSDTPKVMPSDENKPRRSIAQEIIQKSQDIKQEHYRIIDRNDPTPPEPRAQKSSKKDKPTEDDS